MKRHTMNYIFSFLLGAGVVCAGLALLACQWRAPNQSAQQLANYQNEISRVGKSHEVANARIELLKSLFAQLGQAEKIREICPQLYAENAYFSDTLVILHGEPAIQAHFLRTAQAMTAYEASVDDVAFSGNDYYVRWTMKFRSPRFAGGEEICSTGVSQIRFNDAGKISFHQDFWDSGQHVYGHLPVVSPMIHFIQKQIQNQDGKTSSH